MILDEENLQYAINSLSKEYNIIGKIIYFSQFLEHDGEKSIFDYLNSIRKGEFLPNERIVFVQDCHDEYSYDASEHSPGDYIVLIQKYLEKIDITNCFVTIISSNPDIDKEIKVVNKTYSTTDDTLINFINILGDYTKAISKQDTFCVLAWKEWFLKPDAEILPCCSYDRPHNLGNVKSESISDILHGKKAKTLRKNMLNDIKSPGCQTCYYKEKNGIESRRQKKNKEIFFSKEDAKKITFSNGDVKDKNISLNSIELSLESSCNLKCRCCSGDSSSLIANEEEKIFGTSYNKNKILKTQEKNKVVEEIIPYTIYTKKIAFAGGEPTLHKGHYQILDFLLENNKNDTELVYSINGSNLKFKNKSILDYWNNFKNVNVLISVDGNRKQFEYLRHGSDWKTLIDTIQKIKTTSPHVNLGVLSVISSISMESTIELQRRWHTSGIISADAVFLQLINGHNGQYDIQTLPEFHKKRLKLIIEAHCNWLYSINQDNSARRWIALKDYMFLADMSHKLSQAKRDIELIDSFRNENFYETFPELSNMFDGVKLTKH